MKAQDTSELFFQDVKVPADNLLGSMEGQGFFQLMQELPAERLQVALTAVAAAEAAWQWTLDYVQERKAFGKPVIAFQNTRFKLAELKAEITAARVFTDRCLELHLDKKLDIPTAAMLKQHTTDLQCKVMDECVQLHGGYGYMWEYPIARAWADSRVQRIYAGTNEIMKEIVARSSDELSRFAGPPGTFRGGLLVTKLYNLPSLSRSPGGTSPKVAAQPLTRINGCRDETSDQCYRSSAVTCDRRLWR